MRRIRIKSASAVALALLALACGAPAASADFGISALDGSVTDGAGGGFSQAAGHPFDASISFTLNEALSADGNVVPDGGGLDSVKVELPPGLVGNPSAAPTCSNVDMIGELENPCPFDSIVGIALVKVDLFGIVETQIAPVISVDPPPGVAAEFAFQVQHFASVLDASLRSDGDYGIDLEVEHTNQGLTVLGSTVTLWGTPTADAHDNQRCLTFPLSAEFLELVVGEIKCIGPPGSAGGPNSADFPARALITNPSACTSPGVGVETRLAISSWNPNSAPDSASFESHDPPGFTVLNPLAPSEWGPVQGPSGCDQVPFEPTASIAAGNARADSPTGLEVDISVPPEGLANPEEIAQSTLKKTVVTLPEGMTVGPPSARGLGACSQQQLAAETAASGPGQGCPLSSKIGSVEVDTPLLDETLKGSVFLAKPNDNPFNSLLALYIVVKSPERGVVIKLSGKVEPDPRTGRLVTTFDDNPQLPFSNLHLELKSGPRAPLVTPRACGTYTTETDLYPWARPNQPVHSTSSVRITSGPNGSPCPNGSFEPHLQAGTTNPVAGAYSPFVLRLTRDDGTQELSGISARLPKGLVGKLAGIPYCSDAALAGVSGAEGTGAAQIASPSCPSASQIGTVTVGAGAGPNPFYVDTGKAYLAGPYKGAPLSMAFVTPAVAGPFDLGNVVVRAALQVDQRSAQITAVSDPLPRILHGIPLDLRDVRVGIDRDQFTLNPTSCEPSQIATTITSTGGAQAHPSSRFQVGDCASLSFEPKLKLQLKGATKRGGHPALKAVVTYPAYAGGKDCAALGKRARRLARRAKGERRRAQRLEAGSAAGLRARKHARDLARKARDLRGRAKRCPLAAPAREANIARAQVGLPHSEFLDQGNLDKVCRQADLNAGSCPKESIYGYAKAWTPLLAEPLQGPVYLGVGFGYKLPALVADLNGQIRILLVGRVDTTKRKGIRNTFEVVPDAPVSRFELRMKGGKRYGLLENSENICKKKQRASALFTGQNGDRLQMRPVIHNSCGKKKGHKPKRHARHR